MIGQISAAGNATGLDVYASGIAAKDADSPAPTRRDEFVSVLGATTPERFMADVRRTREQMGKTDLKVEAYHLVFSQTNEEANPLYRAPGLRQHDAARMIVKQSFPGRKAKLVTQRDNGRWEGEGADRKWMPGKWHTHVILENVSAHEVDIDVIRDNETVVRHYKAGRAMDGDLKNINRIRRVVDDVVEREFKYDNAKYVEECGRAPRKGVVVAHAGENVTAKDLAMRAENGISSHDEVRVRLRSARARSVSWVDYTEKLDAEGVGIRVTGGTGVSYAWAGADGKEHVARATGKTGLGKDFKKAAVEQACAENAAALARGETLEAPPLVYAPKPLPPEERPVPEYQTPGGKPPWVVEQEAYAAKINEKGTYESRIDEQLREALTDPDVVDLKSFIGVAREEYGVSLTKGSGPGGLKAQVDLGDGPVVVGSERLDPGHKDALVISQRVLKVTEVARKAAEREAEEALERERAERAEERLPAEPFGDFDMSELDELAGQAVPETQNKEIDHGRGDGHGRDAGREAVRADERESAARLGGDTSYDLIRSRNTAEAARKHAAEQRRHAAGTGDGKREPERTQRDDRDAVARDQRPVERTPEPERKEPERKREWRPETPFETARRHMRERDERKAGQRGRGGPSIAD